MSARNICELDCLKQSRLTDVVTRDVDCFKQSMLTGAGPAVCALVKRR